MDRLAALLEQLPLPEIARLMRRTAFASLGVGVAALIVSIALSHPLAGLGACIGLALGLINIRLVTTSVVRVNQRNLEHPKRVLAAGTLFRLGVTTVIVVGLMFASSQLGLASAGGIAVFYFLFVVSLLKSLLRGAQASA